MGSVDGILYQNSIAEIIHYTDKIEYQYNE